MAQLDLIGLIVKDIPAALRFYRLLGMDIPPEADSEGHVEARAGGLRLAWDSQDVVRSFDPEWTPPAGESRGMGLAFLCASPAEVDSLYAQVTAAGYRSRKEPWDAFWGQRYAQVVDPDGNIVDLFAPLGG
jgi:catechol 2,3-dioxygenase-like lactoylglutathione lyase family enzyme